MVRVTAAQKASEPKGSELPSPPPCTQRLDGAGWSVKAIADQPVSSAARANEITVSGARTAGDQFGSPTPCWTANLTGFSQRDATRRPWCRRRATCCQIALTNRRHTCQISACDG